ncbi:NERD domain-containing protein [Sporosarcina oncorhynchi]|uniref:NERD domain-containing protein n=1 Tax=Sporosarcina oncorhynchi TaxID=3056444 RepID=A0ABZ0L350_9BACL|nr:NERD domain-containing protein [Sporosarcina sp. T2O-4]WOV86956.1 NERD domain-containing protein [Sporosarcina sp. T2O-4]
MLDNNMISGFYEGILLFLKMFIASSAFPFVVIFMIVSVVVRWKMPVIKGMYGEWVVKSKLKRLGESYTVFHDVYIPNGDRGLTQVDHIVTSAYGIFVIETKHYAGWIFGDEYKSHWTQVIYKKKTKMHNPIRQNYGHVQALITYIGQVQMQEVDVHSIIAFSPNSTFKFKKEFTSAHVIQFTDLVKTIRQYKELRLSEAAVKNVNEKLTRLLAMDRSEKKQLKNEHIQSVRRAKIAKQSAGKQTRPMIEIAKEVAPSVTGVCPTCNGELVIKKGRYGKFYGCVNYPSCRYTKNMNVESKSS